MLPDVTGCLRKLTDVDECLRFHAVRKPAASRQRLGKSALSRHFFELCGADGVAVEARVGLGVHAEGDGQPPVVIGDRIPKGAGGEGGGTVI